MVKRQPLQQVELGESHINKSTKSEHSLTPYTTINSQWLKGFNIKI